MPQSRSHQTNYRAPIDAYKPEKSHSFPVSHTQTWHPKPYTECIHLPEHLQHLQMKTSPRLPFSPDRVSHPPRISGTCRLATGRGSFREHRMCFVLVLCGGPSGCLRRDLGACWGWWGGDLWLQGRLVRVCLSGSPSCDIRFRGRVFWGARVEEWGKGGRLKSWKASLSRWSYQHRLVGRCSYSLVLRSPSPRVQSACAIDGKWDGDISGQQTSYFVWQTSSRECVNSMLSQIHDKVQGTCIMHSSDGLTMTPTDLHVHVMGWRSSRNGQPTRESKCDIEHELKIYRQTWVEDLLRVCDEFGSCDNGVWRSSSPLTGEDWEGKSDFYQVRFQW